MVVVLPVATKMAPKKSPKVSDRQKEALIELVRAHPELYDQSHEDYKDTGLMANVVTHKVISPRRSR